MKQKVKILWVEDQARHDMVQLIGPVLMDDRYDINVAEDTSEGIEQLLKSTFEVIIVDIRLYPGTDKKWIRLYEKLGKEKKSARLGCHFLYTILGNPEAEIKLGPERPTWIKPSLIGVLTVESHREINGDLEKLGIKVYQEKRADTPEGTLLELIEKVIKQSQ
jgi:hypothetical protein